MARNKHPEETRNLVFCLRDTVQQNVPRMVQQVIEEGFRMVRSGL